MLKLSDRTGAKREFTPLEPGRAGLYHCGPTVKAALDLSKFRSYLLGDVLRRTLEANGLEVTQVMNITDVGHLNEFEEDFTEIAAARTGLHASELIEDEERKFHEERRALHILDATVYPRAREHIDDMIALVEQLEEKRLTYSAGGNVYFDVDKAPQFGHLTGKSRAELETILGGSRNPAHPEKRHVLDIDLWRTDVEHQRHWPSPWGRGFPGWHVECVAMGRKYLGGAFDIHTGAHDNLFPHHECEAAQAESLTGKPLARYWLHSGEVYVEGEPMSLVARNVVTVRELLNDGFRGAVIRAALLSAHYRDTIDFGDACLDRSRDRVNAVLGFREYLLDEAKKAPADESAAKPEWIAEADERVRAAFDDDLDYDGALSVVVELTERLEPEDVGDPHVALAAIARWDGWLGLV